jgi:hypothetical protein
VCADDDQFDVPLDRLFDYCGTRIADHSLAMHVPGWKVGSEVLNGFIYKLVCFAHSI